MKVIIQIGWKHRGYGGRCFLNAWINDVKIDFKNFEGKWITAPYERKQRGWYLASLEVEEGDIIKYTSEVWTPMGKDEKETWERIYKVNEHSPKLSQRSHVNGDSRFPLIEGNLKEEMKSSEYDKRREEGESLYEEE